MAEVHLINKAVVTIMAVLSAMEQGFLRQHNVTSNRINLVTLGAPQAGDRNFVSMVQSLNMNHVYRIAKGADPMPLLPPSFLGFQYIKLTKASQARNLHQ